MVSNPREKNHIGPIRLLNSPIPVHVKVNKYQRPMEVTINRKISRILEINEVWEINMEWWRPIPTKRRYFRVTTSSNNNLIIFLDMQNNDWYIQKS